MSEVDKDQHTKGLNGLILTLLFFVIMVFWTLFFLFVIPEIQKEYIIKGTHEFIEFQSGEGFFTIFGYFCFALLVIVWFAALFTPGYKDLKGLNIFITVLLAFSLLGAAESLFGYSYITRDGAVMRYFISTGEKRYKWDDIKKIKISFYNSTSKTKSDRMIKEKIYFGKSDVFVVRETADGNHPVLGHIYMNSETEPVVEVDDDDRKEWEILRGNLVKKTLNRGKYE